MSEIVIIVNPAAGNGRALQWIKDHGDQLEKDFRDVSIMLTSAPGEAERLASQLSPNTKVVVAVGGDGTINEVVNGMDREQQSLAIIPAGSGNDLIKILGIPENPDSAISLLRNGITRKIDCGKLGDRLFTNSLAMGIDGAVAKFMNRNRWLPSSLAYHVGVIWKVLSFRNRSVTWKSNNAQGDLRANLLAIMNGHTYGGGYIIAPQAKPDDGQLDLVVVGDYRILGRIRHLPKIKTGNHLHLSKVTWAKIEKITIECKKMPPIAIDGELLALPEKTTTLEVEVITEAVRIIVPPRLESGHHH